MTNMLAIIIVGCALALTAGVKHYWSSYPDDNKVEERLEKLIQLKTGKNVDLTPFSSEKIEEVKK
jgi:hypothetical protein